MDLLSLLATISFFFCSFPVTLASLAPISIAGSKFYNSNGNQFYIKGVVYYPSTSYLVDALSNAAQCTRDATLMHTLGVNTIRVYYVDPALDHSGCMSAFDSVGIYVLNPPTWTSAQLGNFSAVVDAFSNFTNTLGFFVEDETIKDPSGTIAAPYIKAAAADLKVYRDQKGYRKIPIGYSSADVAALAPFLQNYFACGTGSLDFFGQNNYQWCSSSSFTISGYDKLYANSSGYSIPIFFSETGCEGTSPRIFDDQEAVLGTAMNGRWSGSVVYEWSDFGNGYGLVSYPSGASTGSPTPLPSNGFSSLLSRWSTLSPAGIPSAKAMATLTAPVCPTFTAAGWQVQADATLPTLLQAAVTGKTSSTGTQTIEEGLQSTGSGTTSTPSLYGAAGQQASATGISTGAKSGIASGVVLFCIFAAFAGFFFWKRKRQTSRGKLNLNLDSGVLEVAQSSGFSSKSDSHGGYAKSELPAETVAASFGGGKPYQRAELPASHLSPYEMDPISTTRTSQSDTRSMRSDFSTTPFVPDVETMPLPQRPSPTLSNPPFSATRAPLTWSNTPWQIDSYPFQQEDEAKVAQKVPLLSATDGG